MSEPTFAVVGHPNKGKSSIVSTLAHDDSVRISAEPGTTIACRHFPMRVDGRVQYTLIDTPGFQRARRALAWMREPLLRATADEAAAAGVPLVVHATTLESARVAVEAGARLLVHSVDDVLVDDAFVDACVAQGTFLCPTLTVHAGYHAGRDARASSRHGRARSQGAVPAPLPSFHRPPTDCRVRRVGHGASHR